MDVKEWLIDDLHLRTLHQCMEPPLATVDQFGDRWDEAPSIDRMERMITPCGVRDDHLAISCDVEHRTQQDWVQPWHITGHNNGVRGLRRRQPGFETSERAGA